MPTLSQAIETTADQGPDRTAAVGDRAWSYEEVEAAANGIAHGLLARCGPDPEPVLVLGGHGPRTAVAMLAVLKAGKFFVSLDGDQPPERLTEIVGRVRPAAAVTNASGAAVATRLLEDAPVLDWPQNPTAGDTTRPGVVPAESDPAWVVFTSGSTGRPKGVVATNRSVLRAGIPGTNPIRSGQPVLVTNPLSWHGGLSSVVRAWLGGGCLHFHDLRASGVAGLADTVERISLPGLGLMPSMASAFADTMDTGRVLASVRRVAFGAESLRWSDVAGIAPHLHPECRITNGLASSETRVITSYACTAAEAQAVGRSGTVPVGRVRDHWWYRILDPAGFAVRRGEPGELLVAGVGLCDGYWRDPDQTTERFRTDADGVRWFSTGDVVSEASDGTLTHLGRVDAQLKRAGVLVAPEEVERALVEQGASEAAVVAVPTRRRIPRLAAHVVGGPRTGDLRGPLRAAVPVSHLPATTMA